MMMVITSGGEVGWSSISSVNGGDGGICGGSSEQCLLMVEVVDSRDWPLEVGSG